MTAAVRAGLLIALVVVAATGCATRSYVRAEVDAAGQRTADEIAAVAGQVEQNQTRLTDHDGRLEELSQTAREALERALAAGRLAEGRFLYETVLTGDDVFFDFDASELSAGARAALDAFGTELKQRDRDLFVEIQGHTDGTGSTDYNLALGARRAESVRRYLNAAQGLPLHRMAVISYGEAAPLADNGSVEGRRRNRRVALVVLE